MHAVAPRTIKDPTWNYDSAKVAKRIMGRRRDKLPAVIGNLSLVEPLAIVDTAFTTIIRAIFSIEPIIHGRDYVLCLHRPLPAFSGGSASDGH